MLVARRYVVSGRVQGVGFRFFTERIAEHEGVHGWVTNRLDGSVEVFGEGEREAMDRFEAGLRLGPPGARVDTVKVDSDEPSGRPGGFSIR